MRFKKFLTLVMGCLLMLEAPLSSQAASISPDLTEETVAQQAHPSQEEASGGDSISVAFPEEGEDTPQAGAPLEEDGQEASISNTEPEESFPEDSQKAAPEVSLNYDTYSLVIGGTLQMECRTDVPAEIEWISEDQEVASVSADGLVTAHSAGTAVITATAYVPTKDGVEERSVSGTITVANTIAIDQSQMLLYLGQKGALKASLGSKEPVSWKSSQPEIASVDKNGQITPKKAGTTVVTASVFGAEASCKVTVKKPELKLDAKATVYLNSSLTLKATAAPGGKITWKSSKPKIATVNAKGKVVPKKTGTVKITATCNGVKKTCKVTVKKSSVKLNAQSTVLFEENACKLKASANPSSQLEWVSSNPKVAKVSKDGRITGLRAGNAKITAVVPGAEASCEVRVLDNDRKLNQSSQILMAGKKQTLYLKNSSAGDAVSFSLSDGGKDIVKLSTSKNRCTITGKKAGKATLKAVYRVQVDGQWLSGESECEVTVIDRGIAQQQVSVAVKKKKSLALKNIEAEGQKAEGTVWSSSDPAVAGVDGNGMVTGKKPGSVEITAAVTYSDGTTKEYTSQVKVSNPKVKSSSTVLSIGKVKKIKLSGTNAYSVATWKVQDPSLASVSPDGTVTAGNTAGKTTVIASVDGKDIKHKLVITNPRLKKTSKTLTTGSTVKISIAGASSKSKITYKSKNKSIATVNKKGVVKAKGSGNTKIVVKADGVSLEFQVNVYSKRAVSACKSGYQIINSSKYSQARRMSNGYYDCSSLVFRAYGCDSGLLGGTPSWAPTAATMASHLERTGKVVSYRGVDVSKLLPGDLIFYGRAGNGRYKNIYHVSMYYGNGYRLEKPLRNYTPAGNIVMIARPTR